MAIVDIVRDHASTNGTNHWTMGSFVALLVSVIPDSVLGFIGKVALCAVFAAVGTTITYWVNRFWAKREAQKP